MAERIRRIVGSGPYEEVTGYSRAVVVDGRVLVAGSTSAVDGDVLHAGDARAQAVEAFGVVRRALESAGTDLRHVVRTRMYVVGPVHCDAVAAVHRELLADSRPAATMVCVAALVHPEMLVEVEVEAVLPEADPVTERSEGGIGHRGLLSPQQFPDDDGTADPRLTAALATGDVEQVVAALAAARVLVPVVAVLGETDRSSLTGLATDKSADMAVVLVTAPDGRQALPVFSSTALLAAWDARARPVPVHARRAALSAVDDGCQLLVVDPGGVGALVPRPALWALAQDRAWVPSPQQPDVVRAVAALADSEPELARAGCEPGRRAELAVLLAVVPGLSRERLDALTARVGQALATSPAVAEHVDSLELRVVPA